MQLKIKLIRWIFFIGLIFFLPQFYLLIKYKDSIVTSVNEVHKEDYGIVFGAFVREDGRLTDVTFERIQAAINLYHQAKISKLFISGDNSSYQQVDAMANFAISRGVNQTDIVLDYFGIDTHDTCKHFSQISKQAILITQGYHLPRSLYFCESEMVLGFGLAVNHLGLIERRGSNIISIYAIRLGRFVREAALTWLYLLGLYDRLSNETEQPLIN